MALIDYYPVKDVIEIDRFTMHLVSSWREQGATLQQINNELDRRILLCGQEVFKLWSKNPNEFELSDFSLLALKYSYGIFSSHGHLPPATEELYQEYRAEILKWKLKCRFLTSRKELVICVMTMTLFAHIQESGKPFIV